MSPAQLSNPKKSHRKKITVPVDSEELAELMGIIAGDGGLSRWQIKVTLSSFVDKYYSYHVIQLFEELFKTKVHVKERVLFNAIVITCNSTEIVDFLVRRGAVIGNKIRHNLTIPSWILRDQNYLFAYLRGLFDTDGCTFIDTHKYKDRVYKHVGIAYSNYAATLLRQVNISLTKANYKPCQVNNRIYIRKEADVIRFFNEIKPSNIRHCKKLSDFLEEYRSGYNGTVSKAVVLH